MFFDLGWSEMLVIGAVALVVIGPKELPNALRTAGYWVRKARSLSREFQGSFEQMIREAELDEVRKDLEKATEFDIESEFRRRRPCREAQGHQEVAANRAAFYLATSVLAARKKVASCRSATGDPRFPPGPE